MTKTPRTDTEYNALLWRINGKLPSNWTPEDAAKWMANFACQLEIELNEWRECAEKFEAGMLCESGDEAIWLIDQARETIKQLEVKYAK